MGVALVRNKCFRSRISASTGSTKALLIVINTLFNIIDSLGNYIFINIYYSPIYKLCRVWKYINDLIVNIALEALYIYTKKVELIG